MGKSVLFSIQDLEGGGAERVVVNLSNYFVENGYKVTILLARRQGVYFHLLHPEIQIDELKANRFLGYLLKGFFYFKNKKFDYVFTSNHLDTSSMILLKHFVMKNAKIIATLHCDLPKYFESLPKKSRLWLGFLYKKIIIHADKMISVSQGVKDGFCALTKYTTNNHVVIYNPTVTDKNIIDANAPLNFDFRDKKVLITVGRLHAQKNHQLLIEAINILNDKNIHLLILGEGPLKNELRKIVQKYGLTENVHLLGFSNNPFPYYSKADLFVLSSVYEGFGNVLVEAMSCGCNVVSTDCPNGPREILQNNTYGWLCQVNNANDMALKITLALNNPMEKEHLKRRSMDFHVKQIGAQYLEFLGQ